MNNNTPNHDTWCRDYRNRRYLQHATHQEITERMDDILVNFIHFTDEGTAVVQTPLEINPYAAFFTHVLEEMKLRGQREFSFAVKNLHLDDKKYPRVRGAAELWRT